jgi:pilus assembly protein Flp/PilA
MKRLNNMLGGCLTRMFAGQSQLSLKREEGQTMVEYALIIATIAILVIVAMAFLQGKISSVFSDIGNSL